MIESLSVGTPVAAYDVTGPKDIIHNGINGYIGSDLSESINKCLSLNRKLVKETSKEWTWENCWKIFKDNLIKARG
jgi:glycosyltransferase involved in cell wall biosynthesis